MQLPGDYPTLQNYWKANADQLIDRYQQSKEWSFIPGLLPELALQLRASTLMEILRTRLDIDLDKALDPKHVIPSPLAQHLDSEWMKSVNMVGINVRTIGNFWNIIRYALTLPDSQKAIHILPIWETGTAGNLYGISSWNLNDEFFSEELAMLFPHLDKVEKQLKVVINILHSMDKIVGMDFIPYCDRFSEIVLSNPSYFEWLQRTGMEIINYEANLHERIEDAIYMFISIYGRGDKSLPKVNSKQELFSPYLGEDKRLRILFGAKSDPRKRLERRNQLIQHLYESGYEPLPVTVAPPYRGIEVDPDPKTQTIDRDGRLWLNYRMTKSEERSQVFGTITRYKLYERLNDNKEWQINFDEPRPDVWNYIKNKYLAVQAAFNFDFMRGGMSHVQMRTDGVPKEADEFYSIHQSVRNFIQKEKPYFGYLAESFLASDGQMAYGNEIAHLELSNADSVIGSLNKTKVGTPLFLKNLRRFIDILQNCTFAPNLTLMTADDDEHSCDEYYLQGNAIRFFLALFVTDMPSYMSLGFESREKHVQPVGNEYYTKYYTFQLKTGKNATQGEYRWGKNVQLFNLLNRIKLAGEKIFAEIKNTSVSWLLLPEPNSVNKVLIWTQREDPKYIFVVNLDVNNKANRERIPASIFSPKTSLELVFTTANDTESVDILISSGSGFSIENLQSEECRVYKIK